MCDHCQQLQSINEEISELKQLVQALLPKPKTTRTDPTPYEQILNLYHQTLPELPRVIKLTETRKRHIRSRFKDMKDLNEWKDYFKDVRGSKFLMGKVNTGRKWKADFDFLISERAIIRTQEGKYHQEMH